MPKDGKRIHAEKYDWKGRKVIETIGPDGISKTIQDSRKKEGDADRDEHWYKKPIGVIVLSATAGLIVLLLGAALRHVFPGLFFAQ
jgi:hypothetical protein